MRYISKKLEEGLLRDRDCFDLRFAVKILPLLHPNEIETAPLHINREICHQRICMKRTVSSHSLQDIKKALGKDNSCYVLITCSKPSSDGKMQVEMSYEGDESLAAYLLENAKSVFDHQKLELTQ